MVWGSLAMFGLETLAANTWAKQIHSQNPRSYHRRPLSASSTPRLWPAASQVPKASGDSTPQMGSKARGFWKLTPCFFLFFRDFFWNLCGFCFCCFFLHVVKQMEEILSFHFFQATNWGKMDIKRLVRQGTIDRQDPLRQALQEGFNLALISLMSRGVALTPSIHGSIYLDV